MAFELDYERFEKNGEEFEDWLASQTLGDFEDWFDFLKL